MNLRFEIYDLKSEIQGVKLKIENLKSKITTEESPSGRWRTPGKCVYRKVSRVRIPPLPHF